MNGHKRPLNRSITVGCVAFIIILCVLLSITNPYLYRNYVYDDYRTYIAEILDLTLSRINADDLERCIETQEESAAYEETLSFMDGLMESFKDIHYFYAVLPLNTNDEGNIMSVLSAERYYDRYIDTEGNLYLGWVSEDEFDAETASKFMETMENDEIIYFEEATEWGLDYTGATAIKNSSGKSIAVLAVDIDISFIDGMVRQYAIVNVCIVTLVGAVFIAFFLFWSRRNITLPIRQLERSAVGFADRSHGQRDADALNFNAPDIKTNNEIKALSDAVVKMTADMRDYVSGIANAEEKAANMQALATRDALTGVRNKTGYDNEIKRAEAELAEGKTEIGIAMIDLNFLKVINDTYGHDKGDEAIKTLCQIVCKIFDHSPVFRIGGDEFVIVLRGHDLEHYDELIAELNAIFDEKAADETLEPWEKISAAVGVAFYDEELDDNLNDLFRRADHVMYDRKKLMHALRE